MWVDDSGYVGIGASSDAVDSSSKPAGTNFSFLMNW